MDENTFERGSRVYTPSALNQEVKLHLETGFPRVLVEAEISNLSRPASGHLYFSLKDASAQIRCAMFRSAVIRCPLQPENGKKVLARGRISLYEPRGEYQFIIEGLRDAGEGRLQQLFERLKKKLEAEGLFAPERKKSLPLFPSRIGVITSPSGAAIRDILQVLARRWPVAQIRIYPVPVQGAEAPGEICAALTIANRERWAELLIMGRGGGSLEDLQAFNEESVARSVAASAIPVICAVGHETDFSICDFVADVRAPTPSAAAELATPDQMQLSANLSRYERLLGHGIRGRLQHDMQRLDYLAHRLQQRDPALRLRDQGKQLARLDEALERAVRSRLRESRNRMTGLSARLRVQHPGRKLDEHHQWLQNCSRQFARLVEQRLDLSRNRLHILSRTLHAVSPLATMGRGYAVLFAPDSGTIVTAAEQVSRGDRVNAQLANGRLYCTVDAITGEMLETGQSPQGTDPP